jgi:hypothetical protein
MKKSLQEETDAAVLQWFSLKKAQGPLVSGPVWVCTESHVLEMKGEFSTSFVWLLDSSNIV